MSTYFDTRGWSCTHVAFAANGPCNSCRAAIGNGRCRSCDTPIDDHVDVGTPQIKCRRVAA